MTLNKGRAVDLLVQAANQGVSEGMGRQIRDMIGEAPQESLDMFPETSGEGRAFFLETEVSRLRSALAAEVKALVQPGLLEMVNDTTSILKLWLDSRAVEQDNTALDLPVEKILIQKDQILREYTKVLELLHQDGSEGISYISDKEMSENPLLRGDLFKLPEGWGVLRSNISEKEVREFAAVVLGKSLGDLGIILDYVPESPDPEIRILDRIGREIGQMRKVCLISHNGPAQLLDIWAGLYLFLSGMCEYATQEWEDRGWTEIIQSWLKSKAPDMVEATTWGYLDPAARRKKASKVSFMFQDWSPCGISSWSVMKSYEKEDVLRLVTIGGSVILLVDYQLKYAIEVMAAGSIVEMDIDPQTGEVRFKIYLRSGEKPSKTPKRDGQGLKTQCEPFRKDTSAMTYILGDKHEGILMPMLVCPRLPAPFAGGLGSGVACPEINIPGQKPRPAMSRRKFGLVYWSLISIGGQVEVAEPDEFIQAMPILGSWVRPGLEIGGIPIEIQSWEVGQVTKVSAHKIGRHTVVYSLWVKRLDKTGQAKLVGTGAPKGSISFGTRGLLTITGGLESTDRPKVIGSEDFGKSSHGGDSAAVIDFASNTLKKVWGKDYQRWAGALVPDPILWTLDGELVFDPKACLENKYQDLISEFERIAKRHVQFKLDMPEGMYLEVSGHLQGDPKDPGVDLLRGTKLEFLGEQPNGLWAVTCETEAYMAWTLVKVESIPISQGVSVTPTMMEIGVVAGALGLDKVVQDLEVNGRKGFWSLASLLLLSKLSFDENNKPQFPVGGVPVNVGDHPMLKDLVPVTLDGDLFTQDPELPETQAVTKYLGELATKTLSEWPKILVACKGQDGSTCAFTKEMLLAFGAETQRQGLAHSVKQLLQAAAGRMGAPASQRHWDYVQFSRLVASLRAQISTMLLSPKVWTKVSRLKPGLSANVVAVFPREMEDNKRLFVDSRGRVAKTLAKLFKCPIRDLEEKVVLYYRSPAIGIQGLRIHLVSDGSVGPDELGVAYPVFSHHDGDVDGDKGQVVPMSQEAGNQLMAHDPMAVKTAVTRFSYTDPEAANSWLKSWDPDPRKTDWARPVARWWSDWAEWQVVAVRNQTVGMPTNANEAHAALALASLNPKEVLGALSMYSEVYEPQLAGPDEKFIEIQDLWELLNPVIKSSRQKLASHEKPRPEVDRRGVLDTIQDKILGMGLSKELFQAWKAAWAAKRLYQQIEQVRGETATAKLWVESGDDEKVHIVTRGNTVGVTQALMAGILRRMTQGRFQDNRSGLSIMRHFGNMVIYKSSDNTEDCPNGIDILEFMRTLAKMGNPMAKRACMFWDVIRDTLVFKQDDED